MLKFLTSSFGALLIAITPYTALAAPYFTGAGEVRDFKGLVEFLITEVLTSVAQLILALSVVWFLWNVMIFIKNSDSDEARSKFREQAVWSIIAIAVMVSLWGLVSFFTNTFFGTDSFIPQLNEQVIN